MTTLNPGERLDWPDDQQKATTPSKAAPDLIPDDVVAIRAALEAHAAREAPLDPAVALSAWQKLGELSLQLIQLKQATQRMSATADESSKKALHKFVKQWGAL